MLQNGRAIIAEISDEEYKEYRTFVKATVEFANQKEFQMAEYIDKIDLLVAGERTPNRTFMHELLTKCKRVRNPNLHDSKLISKLKKEIEEVTNGAVDWFSFQKLCKKEIEKWRRV